MRTARPREPPQKRSRTRRSAHNHEVSITSAMLFCTAPWSGFEGRHRTAPFFVCSVVFQFPSARAIRRP